MDSLRGNQRTVKIFRLVRNGVTGCLCVCMVLKLFSRQLHVPTIMVSLNLLGLLFCGARLLILALDFCAGLIVWQRILLPAAVILGFATAFLGNTSPLIAKAISGVAEVAVLCAVVYLIKRPSRSNCNPFEFRLLEAFELFFPAKIARFAVAELVIVRSAVSGFASIFKPVPVTGFGYVENSFLPMLPILVLLCSPADLLLVHVILKIKGFWWTFFLAFIDIWTLLWLYGLAVSMRLRPHRIADGSLYVCKGFLACANIQLDLIRSVSVEKTESLAPLWKQLLRSRKDGADLTVPGAPAIELRLSRPVAVTKWFRFEPTSSSIVRISSDQPDILCTEIQRAKSNVNSGALLSVHVAL